MKNLFVPLGLTRQLLEIGFKVDNFPGWVFGDGSSPEPHLEWRSWRGTNNIYIGVPSYEQVQDWLVTQGISISSGISSSGKSTLEMWTNKRDSGGWDRLGGTYGFDNRQSALNHGITAAIQILKLKQDANQSKQ